MDNNFSELGKAKTHGHTVYGKNTPTYNTWTCMRSRCNYPKDVNWKYYGGKGIVICERWDSFSNFLSDMGLRPEGKTLDRIDVNGNYEPGNCRWATPCEQVLNRRLRKPIVPDIKKRKKGNWSKGEGHWGAKLSIEKVASIRSEYIPGKITQLSLAIKYGVTENTINRVIRKENWK